MGGELAHNNFLMLPSTATLAPSSAVRVGRGPVMGGLRVSWARVYGSQGIQALSDLWTKLSAPLRLSH